MEVKFDKQLECEHPPNPIWCDLEQVLKDHGAHNCGIFLHPETNQRFGYAEVGGEERWDAIC